MNEGVMRVVARILAATPKEKLDAALDRVFHQNLVWRCTDCDVTEPVQTDGEYVIGDSEPCIHCADGVAEVVSKETQP